MTVWYAGWNEIAHSCPKHVEKTNKHIMKIFVPSWFYLQKTEESTVICMIFGLNKNTNTNYKI